MSDRPQRRASIEAKRILWGDINDETSEESNISEEEIDDESEDGEENSAVHLNPSESDSDTSDEEVEAHSEVEVSGTLPNLVSKSGEIWNREPCRTGRAREINVIHSRIGPKPHVKTKVTSVEDSFGLFFTSEMLDLIVKHTNEEGERHGTPWKEFTRDEAEKTLGLIILAGVYKSKHESLDSLWGRNGRQCFRETMPLYRFKEILRTIRFDNKESRSHRRNLDKFCPIRDLFDMFARQLPKHFTPSESITVDEQLADFRGRCGFRQYMPLKPSKYGLKLFIAVCSSTRYILAIRPYLGRVNNEVTTKLGELVVLDLVKDYEGSGRNVTTDNFYTSLDLARALKRKKLSLVGTPQKRAASRLP